MLHISSVVSKTVKADSEALFGMATLIMKPIVADLCRVKGSNDNCNCKDKKAEVTQDLREKEERAIIHIIRASNASIRHVTPLSAKSKEEHQ